MSLLIQSITALPPGHPAGRQTCRLLRTSGAIRPAAAVLMLAALAAAWPALATASASAHKPAADLTRIGLEDLLNMPVETASRQAQPLVEAPATVTVITRDEIREHGYRTLGDVMRTVPGLYVSNDRNYEYLGVRGFSRPNDYNSRVLLLIDGRRTNDIIFDAAAFDRSFPLDLHLIERIEFVPGPGSALYGANAFFGVINVITRRGPSDDGVQVSVGTGSRGSSEGAVSAARHYASGLDLQLAASGYHSRGANQYYPEFDTAQTNRGVAVGLDDERTRKLHLSLGYGSWRFVGTFSERFKQLPTAPFGSAFNAPGTRTEDSYYLLSLQHESQPARGMTLNAQFNHSTYRYVGFYQQDLAGTGVPPYTVNRDDANGRWLGADVRLSSTRIQNHHLSIGAEFEHSTQARQRNFDLEPAMSYLDVNRHVHRVGVYAQDRFAITDTLSLTTGLRHDQHQGTGSITTPRLALVYRPSSSTTVKLLSGSAYRAPNSYELDYGAALGYQAAQRLLPERISTREIAIEQTIGQQTWLRASIFQNRIRDLIDLRKEPTTGLLTFANLQSAKATGGVLEWHRLWQSGPRVRASLSWQNATDEATGLRLTNSPRLLAKLNLAAPVPALRGTLAIDAQHVSRRTASPSVATPAYTVANLTFSSRQWIPGVTLSASVYNLFNQRYADVGSAEFVQATLPQDGRTVWMRAAYHWR